MTYLLMFDDYQGRTSTSVFIEADCFSVAVDKALQIEKLKGQTFRGIVRLGEMPIEAEQVH